jgi:phosphate:Na+ symporter
MDFPFTLLQLAGYVALLLWGVHMVQTGVQRAFGAKLRSFLGSALRSRLNAFLAGIGVTAILQSSTATGLMVTGFAAGGLVDLVPALAVMLGANVGTTLIVQLLSFDVTDVAPALILIGVLMFRRATAGTRDFGRVLIGLGLVLIALSQFVGIVTPYEDVPSLKMFLGAVSNQPLVDVVLAAGLTWAAHSSVAILLLIMSFGGNNVVPPEAAFALVLGANLGTAINPVLEGATGGDPAGKRLPLGNLLNRAIGVILGLIALPYAGTLLISIEPDPARAVADFHTAFNLILAAVFFPLLRPFAALLRRLLPTRVDPADPAQPMYLAPVASEAPVIAIGAAAREAMRLADILETMLLGLRDAFARADRRQIGETRRLDDVMDKLNTAIKTYLASLDPDFLNDDDHHRVAEILSFATHLEQAGDIVDKSLLGLAMKKLRRGLSFSEAGENELLEIIDRLIANVRAAASLFMTSSVFVPGASTPPRRVHCTSTRFATSSASTPILWRQPPTRSWSAKAVCLSAGCARRMNSITVSSANFVANATLGKYAVGRLLRVS